jgi:hypothetical protein
MLESMSIPKLTTGASFRSAINAAQPSRIVSLYLLRERQGEVPENVMLPAVYRSPRTSLSLKVGLIAEIQSNLLRAITSAGLSCLVDIGDMTAAIGIRTRYRSELIRRCKGWCYQIPNCKAFRRYLRNLARHAVDAARERIERFSASLFSRCGTGRTPRTFPATNPESGGVMGLPIGPVSVERLKRPPRPWPVCSYRAISVVNFY